MNRKFFAILVIVFISILPFIIYLFFHFSAAWSLLIIPAFLIVCNIPKWSVAIFTILPLSILKYSVAFSIYDITKERIVELLIGSIVNYSIFFTVVYFRIKQVKLLNKVRELTLVDDLTGAYNRRYFDMYVEKAVPLGERTGLPLHLILLDIDHFKKVNDSYGHIFGDKVLKDIVNIIKSSIRSSDVLVRLGGEEFGIIVPETNSSDCFNIAERVRDTVNKNDFYYKQKKIHITISLGLAKYQKDTSIARLIAQADTALYQAKANGRNQTVTFNT